MHTCMVRPVYPHLCLYMHSGLTLAHAQIQLCAPLAELQLQPCAQPSTVALLTAHSFRRLCPMCPSLQPRFCLAQAVWPRCCPLEPWMLPSRCGKNGSSSEEHALTKCLLNLCPGCAVASTFNVHKHRPLTCSSTSECTSHHKARGYFAHVWPHVNVV